MQQNAVRSLPLTEAPLFAFDLDGTITTREILPCLAERLGTAEKMAELTRRTVNGELDFARSFRRRFEMLRSIPLALVHESIAAIPLEPHIEAFINSRPEDCAILTGNLDLWIRPLQKRLACRWFCSRGACIGGRLRLLSVLDKGQAMERLAREGRPIIAVGESMNDVPMFSKAQAGIAYAGVHEPAPALRSLAHRTVNNGASLCALLEAYAGQPPFGANEKAGPRLLTTSSLPTTRPGGAGGNHCRR